MDHEKQAGAITLAGVIEIVKYTFEISETRGMRGVGTGTAQRRLDALFRKELLRCWVVMSIGSEL